MPRPGRQGRTGRRPERRRAGAQGPPRSVQRKAFDSLHDELQGYKNNFLLNELHKPVIQNIIRLYDSFLRLEEALPAAGARKAGPPVETFTRNIEDFTRNMENFRVELTEVLARLDEDLVHCPRGSGTALPKLQRR